MVSLTSAEQLIEIFTDGSLTLEYNKFLQNFLGHLQENISELYMKTDAFPNHLCEKTFSALLYSQGVPKRRGMVIESLRAAVRDDCEIS
ncbi:hypothetical protein TNCV_4320621 [Trichonephila clavipes]|nr:hypothetical protein TNCV_4320621 [Trichonephila clavipes]